MKKKIMFALLSILAFGLVACDKGPDFNGGNISPNKNYDASLDFDFIAFGVNRFSSGLSISGVDAEGMALINKPLNSETRLLSKDDLLALGLLNENQKQDFVAYCEATGCTHFKLSLVIPNDPESDDYGKQMIRVTNLDCLTDEQIENGFSYNILYESTILDFDQLVNAACTALGVASIDPFVLNSDSTGIYLWNYEISGDAVTLKFFVINAVVSSDSHGSYVDDLTLEWFDLQL
ncbi:MAG: hypothetical protein WC341_18110 [Bacteroidales bacterium]|jgi:hypothetical protein